MICKDCGGSDIERCGPDHMPIYCKNCDSTNIEFPKPRGPTCPRCHKVLSTETARFAELSGTYPFCSHECNQAEADKAETKRRTDGKVVVTISLSASKEECYDAGHRAGLSEEALRLFRHAGTEYKAKLAVDRETGSADLISIDGKAFFEMDIDFEEGARSNE